MNHNPIISELLAPESEKLYLYRVELIIILANSRLKLHYHENSESVVVCLSESNDARYWLGVERSELMEKRFGLGSVALIKKGQIHDFVAGSQPLYLLSVSTPPIDEEGDVHWVEF
jgi:mannose-6-phosphate isomerase-like protein (cupin superfamily)